jgi:SAM-dependent methyltransferase
MQSELSNYSEAWRAVELAKTLGWRSALLTVYEPAMNAYSADPSRSRFLDLLPLSKDTIVLEIGIGFGQHTGEIASRVKRLDTLEVRLANAVFAKIRCEQSSLSNVRFACGGDDCLLPFPDNFYDVVILNLTLEWCAGGNSKMSAFDSHRLMLSEIHRVLKPNGLLQLSTKNRFAFRLLAGGRDEHSHQIPFGSALPRWLLRLIVKLRGEANCPGYLHSYNALKKLLESVGLLPVASYWAVPEMRFAERFVATDRQSICAARRHLVRQGETRKTEILMRVTPARLVRYFMPGLFFIAQKQ